MHSQKEEASGFLCSLHLGDDSHRSRHRQGQNVIDSIYLLFKLLKLQSCQSGTKNEFPVENQVEKRSRAAFYSSIFIFLQHSDQGYSGFNALKPQHYASRFDLQARSLVKLLNF